MFTKKYKKKEEVLMKRKSMGSFFQSNKTYKNVWNADISKKKTETFY